MASLVALAIFVLFSLPLSTAQSQILIGSPRFQADVEFRTSADFFMPLFATLYYDYDNQRERLHFQENSPIFASPNASTVQLSIIDSVRLLSVPPFSLLRFSTPTTLQTTQIYVTGPSMYGPVYVKICGSETTCTIDRARTTALPQYFVTSASQLVASTCADFINNPPLSCAVYSNSFDNVTVMVAVDINQKKVLELYVESNSSTAPFYYSIRFLSTTNVPNEFDDALFTVPKVCKGPMFCSKTLDVAFLVDGSESILDETFETAKNFILRSVDKLAIPFGDLRVAVLQFSHNVYVELPFTSSEEEFRSTLQSMKRAGGLSAIGHGFRTLGEQSWRPTAFGFAFVITDGKWNFPSDDNPINIARTVKQAEGIAVYSVANGNPEEVVLKQLAAKPYSDRVIGIQDVSKLSMIVSDILQGICEETCAINCNGGLCTCGICMCPTGTSLPDCEETTLSAGAIAGIVLGVLAFLALLVFGIIFAVRRYNRRHRAAD